MDICSGSVFNVNGVRHSGCKELLVTEGIFYHLVPDFYQATNAAATDQTGDISWDTIKNSFDFQRVVVSGIGRSFQSGVLIAND